MTHIIIRYQKLWRTNETAKVLFISLPLFFLLQSPSISQTSIISSGSLQKIKLSLKPLNKTAQSEFIFKKANSSSDILLEAILLIMVVNPELLYENKKLYFGITRELTLGFGKYGAFRTSFEYSYIFRNEIKSQFRTSLKYDILGEFHRGDFLSTRSFISVGAGYFWDSAGDGIFPELAAGFKTSEGNKHEFMLMPYIKIRYTFMITKNKPDNTDFSIGAILGYHLF